MALILHVETATPICSAALSKDGQLLNIKETNDPKSHATKLSPFIEELLETEEMNVSDLDAISVSLGPGSYTGLRIGVSTVKGLAYGANIPVIGISTLQALTKRVVLDNQNDMQKLNNNNNLLLCPMLDARRMEVYSAFFSTDLELQREVQADIITADSYMEFLKSGPVAFFGNGSDKCREIITHSNAHFIPNIELSARYMIQLAEIAFEKKDFLNTAYFEPFYLKDFIATTPKNKIIPPQKTR